MVTDNQLKSLLNDKSLDKVSREQIEEIIDSEMKKDESEIDVELIEYCLDILDDSDNKIRSDFSKKKASRNGNVKYIKPRFKKIIAVAAVIAIVFVAAISGSASVSHHKMYDSAIEIDGDSVYINYSALDCEPQSTDMPDDEIIKELADNGITGVLLPRALLSGAINVTDIKYEYTDWNKTAHLYFTYNGKPGVMTIEMFSVDFSDGVGSYEYCQVSSSVERVKTDKTTAICFMQCKNSFTTIVYRSGFNRYEIEIPVELDEGLKIAETIN